MKILVRGANWIGDAVMSVPAMRQLRRVFPDSRITLHTRSWAYALFEDVDFVDEIVTFDKHRWAVKDVYDNSQFLKDDRYDLAVLFPNSFESALTSFLTRIPRRFGFNKDVRGLLLTDPIAVPEWKGRRHEVYYYLHLVAEVERRVLGRETVMQMRPDASLSVSAERRVQAADLLSRLGVGPGQPIVVLGTGSENSEAKRWPAARFAELNDRLQSELGAAVVLIGSSNEGKVAESIVRHSRSAPLNLTGDTELDEAAAILAISDLAICNDMGLAHLAPALGTPTIVIFGPTDPTNTSPFSADADVIRKKVACAPCLHRTCPIDHRCMTGITTDEVFRAAAAKMNEIEEPEPVETAGFIHRP